MRGFTRDAKYRIIYNEEIKTKENKIKTIQLLKVLEKMGHELLILNTEEKNIICMSLPIKYLPIGVWLTL